MIAIIKGDIIASRQLENQETWLIPLKKLLTSWGQTPQQWELAWGDFFQLEIEQPEEALKKAIAIKALIKKIGIIDVRLAIGIGEKTFAAERISESNGPAFIYAGEKFDLLDKENSNWGIQSPWSDFDEEINLYLRLAGILMDKWTVSSAEVMDIVLHHPESTQEEIGKRLGIKQNSVSGRWKRANIDEILAVEKMFRKKLKTQLL